VSDEDADPSSMSGVPPLRWGDLERAEDANALRDIANEIKLRYKSSPENFDILRDPPFSVPPMLKDPTIWRVRVKVRIQMIAIIPSNITSQKGLERDVVLTILQRAISRDSTSSIKSAFSRDTISGSIYVEAFLPGDVANILQGVHGVLRSRQKSIHLTSVPIDDRIPLLKMRAASYFPISPGSWVRIKHSRRYKHDLGFVFDVDQPSCEATVYVVPRIHLHGKRRRSERERPPPCLFDPQAVRQTHGDDALKKRNQVWLFKGDIYKDGLAELSIHLIGLSNNSVNPTRRELHQFQCSQNQRVVQAVAALNTTLDLRIDDWVEVIAGQHKGLFGHVRDLREDNTVTIEVAETVMPSLDIGRWEICRLFKKGHYVQVLASEYEGKEGFIVDLDKSNATIYCHCAQSSSPDEEVRQTV
jgi:transcription elongation factor SPT5